ncbi:MAG: hypothetical protein HW413_1284 [Thermoleophilia bacterium]|nr:hypothetical protein [Thermoleophilia bacterium]
MRVRSKGLRLLTLAAIGLVATFMVAVSAASAADVLLGVHEKFDRTHVWRIEKSAGHQSLTLEQGQSFGINYTVKLTYLGKVDSNYEIFDGITIEGGSTVNGLSDIDISAGGFNGNPNACSASWSPFAALTPPFPGDFLACTYVLPMGDTLPGAGGVGTANVDVTFADASMASQSNSFDFTNPSQINVFDECVDVSDTYAGALGTVCVGDPGVNNAGDMKTWTYERFVSFADCGEFDVDNTARFITNDTDTTGSASVSIPVHVPCVTGCTLTQGYWKTHSNRGPAPLDTTWNLLPDQPAAFDPDGIQEAQDETFFYSGQTWYQVFWTPSSGGNAYYILAKQYMAARLNILNGASSTSAVNTALTNATNYFNNPANTPASALNLSKSARNTLLGYAGTLGKYNEGTIRGGPPHCDEDGHSAP